MIWFGIEKYAQDNLKSYIFAPARFVYLIVITYNPKDIVNLRLLVD